jgi:hypothetical protein
MPLPAWRRPACAQGNGLARRAQIAAERMNLMLSGLRFVIGAILAAAMLGVGSLGLYATVKLRHQANAGPIESSRNLMFGDRADWNPFYYSDSVRRFERPGAVPRGELGQIALGTVA